jgi:hypothetical protein
MSFFYLFYFWSKWICNNVNSKLSNTRAWRHHLKTWPLLYVRRMMADSLFEGWAAAALLVGERQRAE